MAFKWRKAVESSDLPADVRYRAFLSYRSTDKRQAAWLHGKLERYRIPRRLVGTPGAHGPIPARLRPIFRDRDDARSAADLETIIAQELSKSQHLIVLCTPSAAEERAWVGREVEIFEARRPNAEIHAVIGRGAPPTCFPRQLLSRDSSGNLRQPLAADLRPSREGGDGRTKGVIKLVAGLIGTNFDDLWRRERRRRAWRVSSVMATVALATAILTITISYERTNTRQQYAIADSRRLAGLASDRLGVLESNQLPGDDSRSSSDQLRDNQLDLALLLAVHSYRTSPTYEARNTLLTAIETYPHVTAFAHGHQGVVMALAFTADGTSLVSGSVDETVVLSKMSAGRPTTRTTFKAPAGRLFSMALSRDGLKAAFGSEDGTVMVWDVPHAQQKGVPPKKHQLKASSLAFSPDGRTVAVGGEDEVIMWDVSTGQPVAGSPLRGKNMGTVLVVAFSPDHKTLVSASGDWNNASHFGEVRLWDLRTRTARKTIKPLTSQIRALAFSPDGRTLVLGGWNGEVTSWDIGSEPKERLFTSKHSRAVVSLAFSPDGKTLASGSWDGTTKLWDMASGEPDERLLLKGRTSSVSSLAFSPDGRSLASGDYYGSVILFASAPREQPALASDAITSGSSVAISPDGRTIASGTDEGTITFWDTASGQAREGMPLQGHKGRITGLAFNSDSTILVSGSDEGAVILWDLASQRQTNSLPQECTGNVTSVAITSDGKSVAVGREDGSIVFCHVAGGQPQESSFKGHSGSVTSLAFSPDGKILVSGSVDNIAKVWGVADGRATEVTTLDRQTGYAVTSIAFNPNGAIVALRSGNGSVTLWDVASRRPLGPILRGFDEDPADLTFSPDGKTLTSLSGNVVTSWDMSYESWVLRACRMANRNLSDSEWRKFVADGHDVPYWRTCPDLPPGDNAPADARGGP